MHIFHSSLCFRTITRFASHVRYSTCLIMHAFNNSLTFSLMTSYRFLANVLFFWVTSGESDWLPRWCSAISWEMVPKSCRAHEKMSLYSKKISCTSWRMGGESVVPMLICRLGYVLLMFNSSNFPCGWKSFVASWFKLCSMAELSTSSLEAMKHLWPISLSPMIVCCVLLICTSTVVEYMETEALSMIIVGCPRISFYEEGVSTVRKSRCRVYLSMVKGRVILPIKLMLQPVNLTMRIIPLGRMPIW